MPRPTHDLPNWMTEGKIVYRPPLLLWAGIGIGAIFVVAVLWRG